jgi:hypothetical protein
MHPHNASLISWPFARCFCLFQQNPVHTICTKHMLYSMLLRSATPVSTSRLHADEESGILAGASCCWSMACCCSWRLASHLAMTLNYRAAPARILKRDIVLRDLPCCCSCPLTSRFSMDLGLSSCVILCFSLLEDCCSTVKPADLLTVQAQACRAS